MDKYNKQSDVSIKIDFDKNVAAAATGITTAMLVFKGIFTKKNK